jgi:hypothetical protein
MFKKNLNYPKKQSSEPKYFDATPAPRFGCGPGSYMNMNTGSKVMDLKRVKSIAKILSGLL